MTLCGFVLTVLKSVLPLTNAMTRLTEQIDLMTEQMQKLDEKKSEAHKKLWLHNEEQDTILLQHEMRLHDLDGKTGWKKM